MLRKNLLSLVAAGALTTALSMSAFAGGPTTEMPAQAESGFTLGMNYSNMLETQNLTSNFVLMAGYVNDSFLADFGVNYDSVNIASVNSDAWEMRGDLGLRYMLNNTLFFTYGVTGAYDSIDHSHVTTVGRNPYAVGAFVGLDYQPMNHLLVSFKIDPYLYGSSDNQNGSGSNNNVNRVFSAGSIGASYIFS